MVIIEENQLIIKIKHPCPEELVKDIRNAIIELLQNQAGTTISTEMTEHNSTLLEILKECSVYK